MLNFKLLEYPLKCSIVYLDIDTKSLSNAVATADWDS